MMEIERILSQQFMEALKGKHEPYIKKAWNDYYGHIRNLNALNKNYDLRLYNINKEMYESWKSGIQSQKEK